MTPKITVIMPTYNRADLISKSIESVLNQTYKDFEFLILDDGSTDNTQEVVEKYLSENTHHKLYNVFADVQADIKNIEDNDPFINLNDRLQKIFDNHYVKLLEKRENKK